MRQLTPKWSVASVAHNECMHEVGLNIPPIDSSFGCLGRQREMAVAIWLENGRSLNSATLRMFMSWSAMMVARFFLFTLAHVVLVGHRHTDRGCYREYGYGPSINLNIGGHRHGHRHRGHSHHVKSDASGASGSALRCLQTRKQFLIPVSEPLMYRLSFGLSTWPAPMGSFEVEGSKRPFENG